MKRMGYVIDIKVWHKNQTRARARMLQFGRSVLVFAVAFSWIFSGFPQIFNFPAAPFTVHAAQFAAPNEDISNDGGWAPTPVFEEINGMSPDDGTNVTSGNNPAPADTFEVGLGNVNDPNTNEGHRIRIRASDVRNGARDGFIRVDLYQGGTLIQEGSFQGPLTGGAWDTYTENIDPTNAAAITDYADLRVRVVPDTQGGGQPVDIGVSWIQFEVPDVAAADPPEVATNNVFNINSNLVDAEGEVTDDQGGNVSSRGFVWDTQSYSDPGNTTPGSTDYGHNVAESGSFGADTFTNTLTGLTHATTYYVRAFAENSEGYAYGEELSFTTSSVVPFVDTLSATNIGQDSADGQGEVADTGGETVDERGFVWSTSSVADPGDTAPGDTPYTDFTNETGSFGTGTFSLLLDDLQQDTTYFYRAYARSSEGYSYGEEAEFQTLGDFPVLTTNNPADITQTSADGQAEVIDQGASSVSERGFVWSVTSRSNPGNTAPGATDYEDTVGETGTFGEGVFSLTLSGLTADTTYYYRVYAENTEGYSYGQEVEFQTLDSQPIVSTDDPSNIQTRSVTGQGLVDDDKGQTIDERGFVWSKTPRSNPGSTAPVDTTYEAFVGETGAFGEGVFSLDLLELEFDTTYYYRAYAQNADGYSYGDEASFTTAEAQFARPSADIDTGQWNPTPLFGNINSTHRDDSGSILSDDNIDGDAASLELSPIDAPAGDDEHFIRYTYRKSDAGGHTVDFRIRLLEDGVEIAQWLHEDIGFEYVYEEQALTTTEAAAITDYSALAVELVREGDTGGNPGTRHSVHVSWVEFEAPLPPDDNPPLLSTNQPASIGVSEVEGSGSVDNDGGQDITERGFVWGQSSQPEPDSTTAPDASAYDDFVTEIGTFGEGGFTDTLTSLQPHTTYYYRAYARSSEGYGYGNEVTFQTFDEVPTVDTVRSENVGADSADAVGDIVDTGLSTPTERGFVYDTEPLGDPGNTSPTNSAYQNFVSETGTFTEGEFSLLLDSLTSDTVYYFRTYALNDEGYSYGTELDFRTTGDLPQVSTNDPSNLQQTQVDGEGSIDTEGLSTPTDRGFVWGRSPQANPGNVAPGDTSYHDFTNEAGTFTTGAFSLTIDSLREGTVYYYRAYALNNEGYSYGNEVMFSTPSDLPTMETFAPTDVQLESVQGQGEIVDSGNSTVVNRGFVWDTQSHAYPGDIAPGSSGYTSNTLQSGTFSEGTYSMLLTNLSSNTTYYYRSVSRNDDGWSYGNEVEFLTLTVPQFDLVELNDSLEIALIEGTTTAVMVTANIIELSGAENLASSTAEAVIYRTGVAGAEECAEDDNNCYVSTDCSLNITGTTTAELSCTVDLQFFADPTDLGSPNESEAWSAFVTICNDEGRCGESGADTDVDLLTLLGVSVTPLIDYGVLDPGGNTGSTNQVTDLFNTGNITYEVLVDGTDMIGQGMITVGNQQFSPLPFTYGDGTPLSDIETNTGVFLSKPTSTTPVTDDLYWGLGIGSGLPSGQYNGQVFFSAQP